MLTQVEKYANVEEAYNAHPIPIELKVEEKLKISKQALSERDNQRNWQMSYSPNHHRSRTLLRNRRNRSPPGDIIIHL